MSLVKEVAQAGKLPVVLFTAGGIATPADAAMMMQLGAEGVFVGSGIFKSGNPAQRAEAIVKATTFYNDADMIAKVSRGLGEAMVGINVDELPQSAPTGRARLVVPRRLRTASPRFTGEGFPCEPRAFLMGRESRGQVTVARVANSSRSNSRPSMTSRRCSAAASASAWVR
jgi:imidazole glycerol phosphate synthase subunit HisF